MNSTSHPNKQQHSSRNSFFAKMRIELKQNKKILNEVVIEIKRLRSENVTLQSVCFKLSSSFNSFGRNSAIHSIEKEVKEIRSTTESLKVENISILSSIDSIFRYPPKCRCKCHTPPVEPKPTLPLKRKITEEKFKDMKGNIYTLTRVPIHHNGAPAILLKHNFPPPVLCVDTTAYILQQSWNTLPQKFANLLEILQ
eukprot:TRINITY_DN8566_c0_g1_i3.p1 TRINITY_DN8566_c0_g1~~TRINITY_DN8566_c0_g1_i3.p1  ORF type:complete len:197 (-),score=19.14 TRINITY_DN8566_c0_g1_i3:39-629(-)